MAIPVDVVAMPLTMHFMCIECDFFWRLRRAMLLSVASRGHGWSVVCVVVWFSRDGCDGFKFKRCG